MTPRFLLAMAPVALVLSACATTAADSTPGADHAALAAAVAAADRPEAARKLDESRKPVETLAFLGLGLAGLAFTRRRRQ